MKIAAIDHIINPGAGARIIRSLLPALKRVRPDLDITFFGPAYGMKREQLDDVLSPYGVKMRALKSTALAEKDLFKIRGSRLVISLFQSKCKALRAILPVYLSGAVHKELQNVVKGFDVAFFIWPFHLECPKLDCPTTGIFHDFNYKYYFSSHYSTPWVAQFLNAHVPECLAHFTPIVTSQFVADELRKFYPQHAEKVKIIPLAPMSAESSATMASKVLDKFNIKKPFLLYPTNSASHKNIGPLLSSLVHIHRQGHDVNLVLAGTGTEHINGKACEQGVQLGKEGQNVFGLGYVSHEEIDALIQSAAAVVTCSLYEGNNGSALDAWAHGIPVAMSDMPLFVELLNRFDTKAALFDPRSPKDIAEKVGCLLTQKEQTQKDALHSQKAIQQCTWDTCAQQYLKVFEGLCTSG